MKKYMPIIKDGVILLLVSTAFVMVVNQLFKGLKKTNETDPIVTAVTQGKLDPIKEILSARGFEEAKSNHPSLEEYLKSRANKADEFGRTPLMRVAFANLSSHEDVLTLDKKRVEFAEFLTANGAEANAVDHDGWTALLWAAWSGLPEVTAKLLEKGATPGIQDHRGNSALIIATMRGNVEVVKLLLEKGADKSAKDMHGKIALDYAQAGPAQYKDKAPAFKEIENLLSL